MSTFFLENDCQFEILQNLSKGEITTTKIFLFQFHIDKIDEKLESKNIINIIQIFQNII